MPLPGRRLREPDFLPTAVAVMEAHVKMKLLSAWVTECLIRVEPSCGPKTVLLCDATEILKLMVQQNWA